MANRSFPFPLCRILAIVHFVFFIKACLADPQGSSHNQAELGAVKHNEAPATTFPDQPVYGQQQVYPPAQQQPYATQ
jgi:hypothetical protein